MSQYIKFQQVSIDGVVIKVGGNNIAVYIICRMLYRRKFFNFLPFWKNNDSSGVLSCCAAHSGTSLNNSVNLAITLMNTPLLKIILHIAKGCLFRQRTDSSRLKGLPFSENNFRIAMCVSLIFSRKVKVNIRLLISLKSKEGFKRNIEPFFIQLLSAYRADFIRHITSCHSGIFFYFRRVKFAVFALRTNIMGRKGIYLCNSRHSCRKRRTDRSTGSHKITVLI